MLWQAGDVTESFAFRLADHNRLDATIAA